MSNIIRLVSLFALSLTACSRMGLTEMPKMTAEPADMMKVAPDLESAVDMAKSPDLGNAGKLTVSVNSDTPASYNFEMGMVDTVIYKFDLQADAIENVLVTQIIVSIHYDGEGAMGLPKDVRITDDATGLPVGTAVAQFSPAVNGKDTMLPQYAHAVFSNLNLTIPRGIRETFRLVVEFGTYEKGGFTSTGQTIVPTVLRSYTNTPGTDFTVTAVGVKSGQVIEPTVDDHSLQQVPGAYGNILTLYRAKLMTSWASDTPSGSASPAASQIVGKFVLTGLVNSGNYPAHIQSLNLDFASNIKPATADRVLSIYKDSLATTPVATYTFTAGQSFKGASKMTEADLNGGKGLDIASGSSRTFWVTLDTSDASASDFLSVRINSGGVVWSDGVSTDITAMGDDLPLLYKSCHY